MNFEKILNRILIFNFFKHKIICTEKLKIVRIIIQEELIFFRLGMGEGGSNRLTKCGTCACKLIQTTGKR